MTRSKRRIVIRSAIAIVAFTTVITIGPGSAGACSIAGESMDHMAEADAVFVGTTTSVETRDTSGRFRSQTAIWTFTVEGVAKGDVAATQVVLAPDLTGCGNAMGEDGRYVVYAEEAHDVSGINSSEPMLVASYLGGTRRLTGALPHELDDLGELHPPRPGYAGYPDGRRWYAPWIAVAVAVAGLLAAVGASLAHRRRVRNRAIERSPEA